MHDLERFISGFQRFQQQYFDQQPSVYDELKQGQHPTTLLIGCCDSRVDPALLLGCDPGDIFTVRNVANLVPPCTHGMSHQGVSSAIQFAVDQLQVSRIIILGHAQCGGIRALVEQRFPTEGETDFIGRWVHIADSARQQVFQLMPDAEPAAQRRACELAAILVSLKNLMTFPWVAQRVNAGSLTLHGWYFDLDSGALLAYSPRADAFLPLVCPLVPDDA
ncbi:carbonic anhydrase [Leeia aquatica]|uniref:Carbonic anhydrase n=1 Tax=Leeia aquatica TaxID=2725557 RepID=A0A847S8J1_9NEIS|nr:carbonic anhydrase [Leeia aquatica]NLR73669.1 carbonic anhydrase [Leeia aquatica]